MAYTSTTLDIMTRRLGWRRRGTAMNGVILKFPRHARASSIVSRAAMRVRVSADTPDACAVSVARIDDHQSAGMVSRCHHFETAAARAPMADAIASREDHSSITDLNDVKSDMIESIGQRVLKDKDETSLDSGIFTRHNVLMKQLTSIRVSKDHFTARVAYARHKANYTQAEMAEALGLGPADDPGAQSKYQKYEKRSWMPHELIPAFCALCDITTGWLYSGPIVARPVEKRGRKPKQIPASRQRKYA